MPITRRLLLAGTAAAFAAPSWPAFAAPEWPARIVKTISPYGAGGANDISLRIINDFLERELHQQFIVENKPGAGTRLANEMVAHSQPDGYTFLYAAAPYATAEALFGKLNYQRSELRPVAMAAFAPIFLIVNAKSDFKTLPDLIAYGKSKPEGLTFGSPGPGSQPHLAAELLFKTAGVKGLNVPLRGDAAAYTELLAGRVDATFTAISSALPHIQAGNFRVLGAGSVQRSAIYPDAPTLVELGFPQIVAAGWYGFMAPAATPVAVIDRMQDAVLRALGDAEVKKKLIAQGLEAHGLKGAEFAAFIDAETAKWSRVIEEAGLREN